MTKTLSIFSALSLPMLALVACGSQPAAAPSQAASTPQPSAAQTSVPETPQPTAPAPESGDGAQAAKPANPNRIYQLTDLEKVKIKINEHEFMAWVMDTNSKRQEGMMFLKNEDFKDNEAMIFVFKEPQPLSFWMRNTLVDLDIAYVSDRKRIINTTTMKALDETGRPSNAPAKYAIEFRAGLLRKLGIRAGMTVQIPDSVKAKE